MHTFTENSHNNGYFQIRAGHDMPKYNVKEGDLGGYVQKGNRDDNKVDSVTNDSWVAQGCYVDSESFINASLINGGSAIKDSDIFASTIDNSSISSSDVEYSNLTSAHLDQNCYIFKSEVSDVILRAVTADYSTISPADKYGFIHNVKLSGARITDLQQYMSVSPIGTERQTATLYPHKDTGKPTVRIGCWHGALENLPKEVAFRLGAYVRAGNPEEKADNYAKEYQAFQTYAETYAEMFINN